MAIIIVLKSEVTFTYNMLPMILVPTQIINMLGGEPGKFTCRKNK